MARRPIAQERPSPDGDGLVVLELTCAFSDETTHVLFESQDFIARLMALVPRPNARERGDNVARPRVASKATRTDELAANGCTST